MTARARFTKDDVRRATSGVEAAGLPVGSVEIDPTGKIVIHIGLPNQRKAKGWDDLR